MLLVSSSYPRWTGDSTSPFILNLARDLRRLDWDIHVLAPHAPGASRSEWLEEVPVERFRYLWPESLETVCYQGGALVNLRENRWNLAKLPFLVLAQWAAVARRLIGGKFDLVHSHWIIPQGFTCALASKPLRVPHVATVHGSDVFALRGPLKTACKKVALRLADAVTVNSSATGEAVAPLLSETARVSRIPMGAAACAAPNSEIVHELRGRYRRRQGPLLIFVGRLVPQKGVADFLAAVSLLVRALPDVTALVVGDGQERRKLESLALDLGIAERVTFTGWIQPQLLPNYFSAADAFIGPSRSDPDGSVEAQGLTFVEAMLAGTPVIATATGGIVDVVQHERTGLLVRENAPAEIAAAAQRLEAEPLLVERLRTQGMTLARSRYTREASARAFSALYEDVLSGRVDRAR